MKALIREISSYDSIAAVFAANIQRSPSRIALMADGKTFTYKELGAQATGIAAKLEEMNASQCVGVYAHRTSAAYAGILGVLASGRTYVPLNPKFPEQRNRAIVESAGIKEIISDANYLSDSFLLNASATLITLASSDIVSDKLNEMGVVAYPSEGGLNVVNSQRNDLAYIMFTSGTTGVPKGVPITHDNVLHYVTNILALTELKETDRFSQTFDLTFDLSVHDMFVCWSVGAGLYVLPERAIMAPAKFIREHEISVWFSVPSTIGFMHKLRTLKPNSLPSLRCSWFCGEALPARSARLWQTAAPNTFVENLYGPTEATIAFTYYRWQGSEVDEALSGGFVPIGEAMGSLETVVTDENREQVLGTETGELCLGGNQLSPGYWKNSETTAEVFFEKSFPGMRNSRWYRTGDLATENSTGQLEFVGRLDSQVKILGHRVELGEVERVVRLVSGSELVAAVAWPREGATASGIVIFMSGGGIGITEILEETKKLLPPYMVPKVIKQIDTFPMNANGKIDRRQLEQTLENG